MKMTKRLTLEEFKRDPSLSHEFNGTVFGAGANECEVPCEVPCEDPSLWDIAKAAAKAAIAFSWF
jgi:hypothetical protein